MEEWLSNIISAFIGGAIAIIGVLITFCHERKKQTEQEIERAKPIIINASRSMVSNDEIIFNYLFESDSEDGHSIVSVFKNTSNGILFFDYIETASKKYYPFDGAAVDKNTFFQINLYNLVGDNLEKIELYGHDIYGNRYVYEGNFTYGTKHSVRYGDFIFTKMRPLDQSKHKRHTWIKKKAMSNNISKDD